MGNPARCTCTRCTIRGLMGPVLVTTLGLLFLLAEFDGWRLSFGHTFPVLFIVAGALLLASALAPLEGHVAASPAGASPPTPPAYPGPHSGQGH